MAGKLKALALLLLTVSLPLAASTSYSVIAGMGHMSNFAFGNITSFPASARIEQGVKDLDWFDGVDTSMFMDMSFGLTQRRLIQDPRTGEYLTADQEAEERNINIGNRQFEYSAFYSQISYRFRNALYDNRKTESKYLTLDAALNVRFEQAFDSFDNIRSGKSFLDEYLTEDGVHETYWNADRDFIAMPDIAGEAYMLANSLSFSATWNDMYTEKNKIYREGLSASGTLTLAPWFLANRMDTLFDTSVDYYAINADVTWAKVLFNKEDWKRWNEISIVLENRVYAQILLGADVPKFADTISFPGLGYTNLPLVIQNQLKLYIYGPNFLSDNTIPYGYVFLDTGLATGIPNNSRKASWQTFAYVEIGLNLHVELMGALHLTAEVSYVFSNIETYGNFFDWNVGAYFSF